MLNIGNVDLCGHNTKTLAANTAAASSKKEAQTGKSGKVADTSCHHLSKRDLRYFSSETFEKTLKYLEDSKLAYEYGRLIASRKRVDVLDKAWDVVDAIIYVDIFNAHYDGFNYTYEEVKCLFMGYRSQALRELKLAKGFNALVYRELAKALNDKREIRSFLKAMNRPIVRKSLNL